MTQESFAVIKPGAQLDRIRVCEGAALVEYDFRRGVIEDRNDDLAKPDARSFIVQDEQIGSTVAEIALENINPANGEAAVAIREYSDISPALLQQITVHALKATGVREAFLNKSLSNVPTEQLQRIGFHAIKSKDSLAFAA